ncbi:hypothetical protein QP938_02200 [Porticoccaceae bacterium LTM1]|nr:hypothetical protein QP938_02200 [Porticoccaceae bacterium LTM1]
MKTLLFSLFVLLLPYSALAADYVIHAGKLIDVVNGKVLADHSIVISENKIVSIDAGFTNPTEQQQVIDLKDSTVIAGPKE